MWKNKWGLELVNNSDVMKVNFSLINHTRGSGILQYVFENQFALIHIRK